MRINVTECPSLGDQGGWACESMTYEDATSPFMGALELHVLDDTIINKEPLNDGPDGTNLLLNRRIVGLVVEYLPLWSILLGAILNGETVAGISLPEEGKVFLKGQAWMSYEPNDGLVEITVLEATRSGCLQDRGH